IGLHRVVGCAKIDGLGDDLLLSAARTDRLVIDAMSDFLLILGSPLRVSGLGEGRACAGDVDRVGRQCRCGQSHTDGNLLEDAFEHEGNPVGQSGESGYKSVDRGIVGEQCDMSMTSCHMAYQPFPPSSCISTSCRFTGLLRLRTRT